MEGDKPAKETFKCQPIGYCHVDFAESRMEEEKRYPFVAIDWTSNFSLVYLVYLAENSVKMAADAFPHNFVEVLPYAIHTILTDSGIQFTNHTYAGIHIFDRFRTEYGIERRLTKSNPHGPTAKSTVRTEPSRMPRLSVITTQGHVNGQLWSQAASASF